MTRSSLPLFLSIWLFFPNQNYQSQWVEYNFNWWWHRTLHLKKKRFPIFENLLKTFMTTTKVLNCLKIPLTSMRIERLASCENFVPRFQTSSILPFRTHTPDWYLNSHEETLLQQVLKSFITIFIITKGWNIN